ncbi:MAG: FAD/NAD(P)-binding protein [Balneolaceae bacterium]
MEENSAVHKVAIIGGGPKGLYAFERLTAQFKASPPSERVEIHIYNRSTFFGAGEIYRTDQPTHLITNTPIGEINMWTEGDPPPVISNPLPLTKWLYLKETTKLHEDEYIDRATVGRYLTNGFELIASNLPKNVYGKYIIGEVADLNKDGETYALTVKINNGDLNHSAERYHHILLATGHPINRSTKQDDSVKAFAEKHEETGFIPFIYPTEYTFLPIIPDSSIGIKGMGLTFVDAVLSLTEGKGGTFKRNYNEKLVYQPSGNEPKVIYPFSRSGLPMIPRKPSFWNTSPLKYFTRQAIENHHLDEKIDFKTQLLPLIKQDMTFSFYEIKMKRFGFKDDLVTCQSFEEVEEFIKEFHEFHPDVKRFEPDLFLSPLRDKIFLEAKSFNQYIYDYLTFFIKEARKGELISPWAAATAIWRKAVPLFCEFYSFGGFTPSSQREFDSTYRGLLNRVTFGPAVESTEKLVALMEDGILHFDIAENPDLILDEKPGMFVLNSKLYNTRRSVHTLVDARISKVSLPDDRSTLYENLLNRGEIVLFQNGSDQGSYQPGSIAITPEGFVVDKSGNINTNIVVIGTPTEGITYDNDTLSTTRNNFASKWAAFICKTCTRVTVSSP